MREVESCRVRRAQTECALLLSCSLRIRQAAVAEGGTLFIASDLRPQGIGDGGVGLGGGQRQGFLSGGRKNSFDTMAAFLSIAAPAGD
jgi:hypothetical protein